jgi:hypothetical protein
MISDYLKLLILKDVVLSKGIQQLIDAITGLNAELYKIFVVFELLHKIILYLDLLLLFLYHFILGLIIGKYRCRSLFTLKTLLSLTIRGML